VHRLIHQTKLLTPLTSADLTMRALRPSKEAWVQPASQHCAYHVICRSHGNIVCLTLYVAKDARQVQTMLFNVLVQAGEMLIVSGYQTLDPPRRAPHVD
jgi:hypothetical protein